jgi:hypothetical protein
MIRRRVLVARCGMGILPMVDGLAQTHGQDARATAYIQMLPTIERCAKN